MITKGLSEIRKGITQSVIGERFNTCGETGQSEDAPGVLIDAEGAANRAGIKCEFGHGDSLRGRGARF